MHLCHTFLRFVQLFMLINLFSLSFTSQASSSPISVDLTGEVVSATGVWSGDVGSSFTSNLTFDLDAASAAAFEIVSPADEPAFGRWVFHGAPYQATFSGASSSLTLDTHINVETSDNFDADAAGNPFGITGDVDVLTVQGSSIIVDCSNGTVDPDLLCSDPDAPWLSGSEYMVNFVYHSDWFSGVSTLPTSMPALGEMIMIVGDGVIWGGGAETGAMDIVFDIDGATVVEASNHAVVYQMIRRDYSAASGSSYKGSLQVELNGQPATSQNFIDANITNSSGAPVAPIYTPGLYTDNYIGVICTSTSCGTPWTSNESGISFKFNTLPLDDYTVTVNMADGQLSAVIPFDEDVFLPVIDSSTMQTSWQGGDLYLSWTNPTTAPDWDRVTALRVGIFDASGNFVGWIKALPTVQSLIVPEAIIQQIKNIGDGTVAEWNIQTRLYTGDSSNSQIARSQSLQVDISEPNPYTVAGQSLRNYYVAGVGGSYAGSVGVKLNGEPASALNFIDATITNSSGGLVDPTNPPSLDTYNYVQAFCQSLPCTWGTVNESDVKFEFNTLPLDDYTVTINMTDGQLNTIIPFDEDVTLPAIDSATMQSSWEGGDLHLSWTNPTTAPAWDRVTALRVRLDDASGHFVGWAKTLESAESLILTDAMIQDMKAIGDGTVASWNIQTRLYTGDSSNGQIARSQSLQIDISEPGKSRADLPWLMLLLDDE